MKTRMLTGLACLLGALASAEGACAAAPPPVQAVQAVEACKASWSAKQAADPAGPQTAASHAEFTRPSASVLCMRGTFERDTPGRLRAIADPAAVTTLVVNSDGGWTEPAIELATLAERHRWLVVVEERCLSSCANYVFLSRTEKVVMPEAMLGWHGLPKEPGEFGREAFRQMMASAPPGWADLDYDTAVSYLAHSKAFLAERGIPPELCRGRPQVGHSQYYVARLNRLGQSGAGPFWSYGREALETRFGVTGILSMWEPHTPDEGTAMAMERHRTTLFYFDLSSR